MKFFRDTTSTRRPPTSAFLSLWDKAAGQAGFFDVQTPLANRLSHRIVNANRKAAF